MFKQVCPPVLLLPLPIALLAGPAVARDVPAQILITNVNILAGCL